MLATMITPHPPTLAAGSPSPGAEDDSQPPNGWRLSGDGGEADGVRCSRGLDGGCEGRELSDLIGCLSGRRLKHQMWSVERDDPNICASALNELQG